MLSAAVTEKQRKLTNFIFMRYGCDRGEDSMQNFKVSNKIKFEIDKYCTLQIFDKI